MKFNAVAKCQDDDSDWKDSEWGEGEWDWDQGVPRYPKPRYDANDDVVFFPRIIGGTPAFGKNFKFGL